MSEFLNALGKQRARIARMVDIFDAQLEGLRDASGDPDYRLLREIARYFCHYPTSTHYPFEDRLYARLAELRPDYGEQARELARRHERHAGLAQALHDLLDGACSGHMVPRDRLLKEANAYVVLQREHMMPLAEALFAAAGTELGVADVAAVEAACGEHTDPEVRARVEEEFARIEKDIEEELAAAA